MGFLISTRGEGAGYLIISIKEQILAELKLTHDSFLKRGVNQPRIAVAEFNPHAGRGGLPGHEKIEEI